MLYFYAIVAMLDFLAIVLVINEDIFYEIEDKFFKIFWILVIPFFGAIFAMIKLNRFHNYPKSECGIDGAKNHTRTYEIVNSSGGFDSGK